MNARHLVRIWFSMALTAATNISSECMADSFEFLNELPGSLCLDENVNAGIFGIHIENLNAVKVDELLWLKAKQFQSQEDFREALCEKLVNPETCLAAYALLNQLYPQDVCRIATKSFGCAFPMEGTKIPISIDSGHERVELDVGISAFGAICREYWREKLHVRSEVEKTLDETRPGWRKEFGIPETEFSQNSHGLVSDAPSVVPRCQPCHDLRKRCATRKRGRASHGK